MPVLSGDSSISPDNMTDLVEYAGDLLFGRQIVFRDLPFTITYGSYRITEREWRLFEYIGKYCEFVFRFGYKLYP